MNDYTGPGGPSQHLGAVPGTADAVPGFEGPEPEDIDGAEFASSGHRGPSTMTPNSQRTCWKKPGL